MGELGTAGLVPIGEPPADLPKPGGERERKDSPGGDLVLMGVPLPPPPPLATMAPVLPR